MKDYKMKIKELIKKLKLLNQDEKIVLSSDEELNTLYEDIQVEELETYGYVIWGNSGSEK